MYGQVGQPEEGLRTLTEALTLVEAIRGAFHGEAELHRLSGALLLAAPSAPPAEAEACFQQALAVARRQQAKSLELRAAMSLSRLWQRQGKRAEARELLAPIYGWFTEGFDTADLQEAKALLEAAGGITWEAQYSALHYAQDSFTSEVLSWHCSSTLCLQLGFGERWNNDRRFGSLFQRSSTTYGCGLGPKYNLGTRLAHTSVRGDWFAEPALSSAYRLLKDARMVFFVALLVHGLLAGSLYALIALAFVVVYKASRLINFALGDFVMFAARLSAAGLHGLGLGLVGALGFGCAGMVALALGFNRLVLRPLVGSPVIALIMVTIGLGTLLRASAFFLFQGHACRLPCPSPGTQCHPGRSAIRRRTRRCGDRPALYCVGELGLSAQPYE